MSETTKNRRIERPPTFREAAPKPTKVDRQTIKERQDDDITADSIAL
ncbi:MAG: hypothetical protein AAGM67_03760 [Bacteroidota bacterium]